MQAVQGLRSAGLPQIEHGLAEFPRQSQQIPLAAYAGVQVRGDSLQIAAGRDGACDIQTLSLQHEDAARELLNWLKQAAQQRSLRWVAAAIEGERQPADLPSRLWLQEDIVPYTLREHGAHAAGKARPVQELLSEVSARFDENDLVRTQLLANQEVQVAELVTLEDYQRIAPPQDFALLLDFARAFQGQRLAFINATPQGGGVALMRHALIRLLRLLQVDAHWYTLLPNSEVFAITKAKFHNVLQAVASRETVLTAEDMALYDAWMSENASALEGIFKQADVIVIDDPQPAGLIPYIRRANPAARIVYRSHIQIVGSLASQPGTPQHTTWSFLWEKIQAADCFVSHPMEIFIPQNVPAEKICYMPATTDPLDGLNKPLTQEQVSSYLDMFNALLLHEKQTPLDVQRPYIIQIARFDPSKGIPDVLEAYRKLREMLQGHRQPLPQLVITGNGSIDDPDGVPVYSHILQLLQGEAYSGLADDIKVVRLPHRDQILNALLRACKVALQLSIKEGFEVKVTEALMKGKPVIAYKAGGIPLQIQDGVTGHLVERGDTTLVALHLYRLLTNEDAYQAMSSAAHAQASKDYLTVSNAICWLYLAGQLVAGEELEGHHRWVKDLAEEYYARRARDVA